MAYSGRLPLHTYMPQRWLLTSECTTRMQPHHNREVLQRGLPARARGRAPAAAGAASSWAIQQQIKLPSRHPSSAQCPHPQPSWWRAGWWPRRGSLRQGEMPAFMQAVWSKGCSLVPVPATWYSHSQQPPGQAGRAATANQARPPASGAHLAWAPLLACPAECRGWPWAPPAEAVGCNMRGVGVASTSLHNPAATAAPSTTPMTLPPPTQPRPPKAGHTGAVPHLGGHAALAALRLVGNVANVVRHLRHSHPERSGQMPATSNSSARCQSRQAV